MPHPERLLNTLHQAVQAFRSTPGRSGRLVRLPAGVEVLVAGDMHGSVENFRSLLKVADLPNHPCRRLILQEVVHGPFRYPDGSDKSHQLLDVVAALKCQYPDRVHFLLGNHELAQWRRQSVSKNDVNQTQLLTAGVHHAYGEWDDAILGAYDELFASADLAVRTDNRVFVSHSLPSALKLANFRREDLERDSRPEDLDNHGAVYALVWGRDTRPTTVQEFLARVDADLLVSGHIACDDGFDAPNDRQLIVDCAETPAGYVLFPTDRPLTHEELVGCVRTF